VLLSAIWSPLWCFILMKCVNLQSLTGSMLPCVYTRPISYLGVYFVRTKYFIYIVDNAKRSQSLSLSAGNSLLFPHDVTIKASFLLFTVSNSSLFTPALLRTHSFVFFAVRETRRILFSVFHLKGVKTRFFIPSECPAFTAVRCYRPH